MNKKHHKENHNVSHLKNKDIEQAIKITNDQILEATQKLGKELFDQSMPSPLETDKQRASKCKHEAQHIFEALRVDIKRGVDCYTYYAHPAEKYELNILFGKIFENMEKFGRNEPLTPLTDEDIAPLDTIATRAFTEKHLKEASCMWRLILQLQPVNSRAWVGWAIAEQMNHHTEIAEHIYRLGRELIPHDIYLALFTADFYLTENKTNMAREIIHKTIDILKRIDGVEQEAFVILNEKLVDIESFEKTLASLRG
jgi:hypothetical protein